MAQLIDIELPINQVHHLYERHKNCFKMLLLALSTQRIKRAENHHSEEC